MLRLDDVHADDLVLGPLTAQMSGAVAEVLEPPGKIQSPWLTILSTWMDEDSGKRTVVLDIVEEGHAAWLAAIDGALKEQLSAQLPKGIGSWKQMCSQGAWKVSLPSSAAHFGAELRPGVLLALAFEVVGVWCWREMAGVKLRVLQTKALQQ